ARGRRARSLDSAWNFLEGVLLLRVGRDAAEAAGTPSVGGDAAVATRQVHVAGAELPCRARRCILICDVRPSSLRGPAPPFLAGPGVGPIGGRFALSLRVGITRLPPG